MKLNYFYQTTPTITANLRQLEVLKQVFDLLPQLPNVELNIRRHSLLKSSLFSARIEGNQLQLNQLTRRDRKTQEKIEVYNILDALNWIYSPKTPKNLSKDSIIKLHQFVLKDLNSTGKFRTQPSAIFNQAGIAVYLPPPPQDIPELINQLIKQINSKKESGFIKAATSHFAFEKIHPFMDGNGRVGRLLSTYILKFFNYDYRGLVNFEEYLENHRSTYYDLLSIEKKDITEFVEFFLQALSVQAKKVFEKLKSKKQETPEDRLLPRRQEILAVIRDHKLVSFDFIARRFRSISSRSLHYDLQHLTQKNFIKKLGATRGALYSPTL